MTPAAGTARKTPMMPATTPPSASASRPGVQVHGAAHEHGIQQVPYNLLNDDDGGEHEQPSRPNRNCPTRSIPNSTRGYFLFVVLSDWFVVVVA